MRRGPIYKKNNAARSCASALERIPSTLDRACLRSSTLNRLVFPRYSNESNGARDTRGSQVYVACA
jgi:hypothetical protein